MKKTVTVSLRIPESLHSQLEELLRDRGNRETKTEFICDAIRMHLRVLYGLPFPPRMQAAMQAGERTALMREAVDDLMAEYEAHISALAGIKNRMEETLTNWQANLTAEGADTRTHRKPEPPTVLPRRSSRTAGT
jgi:Arc/MetJ-type ribon-helix-helix transcriptional regulator